MESDWVYDIETYMDLFSAGIVHVETNHRFIFEVSGRRDQSWYFINHLKWMGSANQRLFGFNNEGFDWYVCQKLIEIFDRQGYFTAHDAYLLAQQVIESNDRFGMTIWPDQRTVTQGDLFKIHHFDNFARSTSLKKLEIAMRSRRVVDLPYSPHEATTSAQKDEIISYMCHDISETKKFYWHSLEQIKFRDTLARDYPDLGDVLNFNDTKIGKKFFEMKLIESGVQCYTRENGRRAPIQTRRETIALRDVISPKVQFNHPEFQRVLGYLKRQVLTKANIDESLKETTNREDSFEPVETKGVFKNLNATIDGFTYDFGTGGIHGSATATSIHENDEWEIWDWDVASYYPNLAISNGFYPAHLSDTFCSIYRNVYDMRKQYGKKTAENAMLKLALNGVYGDSNNKYSPFYDPQYTMSITVNGQLMLCMLAEWLRCDYLKMVQINTDGLTVMVHKSAVDAMKSVCASWESHTGLELESVRYREMHIRDVNNYIAVKEDGSVKRIGAYTHETPFENPSTRERQWHKNHSGLVVKKAAEARMVHSIPVRDFIMNHNDPFDFMMSVKVGRGSRLYHGQDIVQNTTRFYVSTNGQHLTKVMPPLAKAPDVWREMGVQAGWLTTVTNNADHFSWNNVNWYYYIKEAEKLVIGE